MKGTFGGTKIARPNLLGLLTLSKNCLPRHAFDHKTFDVSSIELSMRNDPKNQLYIQT